MIKLEVCNNKIKEIDRIISKENINLNLKKPNSQNSPEYESIKNSERVQIIDNSNQIDQSGQIEEESSKSHNKLNFSTTYNKIPINKSTIFSDKEEKYKNILSDDYNSNQNEFISDNRVCTLESNAKMKKKNKD